MSSVELPVKRPCDAHMNTLPAPSLLMRLHSTDSWAAVSRRKSEEEVRGQRRTEEKRRSEVWKEARKQGRGDQGKGESGRKSGRGEERSSSIPAEERAQHNRDSEDKCACPVWYPSVTQWFGKYSIAPSYSLAVWVSPVSSLVLSSVPYLSVR